MRLTIEQNNQEEFILKKLNDCLRLYSSYIKRNEISIEYEATLKSKLKDVLNIDLWFVSYLFMNKYNKEQVNWVRYELFAWRYTCDEKLYLSIDLMLRDLDIIIDLYKQYIKPWTPSIKEIIKLQFVSKEVLALLQWKINEENLPKHIIRTLEDINELITRLWIDLRN